MADFILKAEIMLCWILDTGGGGLGWKSEEQLTGTSSLDIWDYSAEVWEVA